MKTFFFFALLTCWTISASSQLRVRLGVETGLNEGSLHVTDYGATPFSVSAQSSLAAGALVEVGVTDWLSVQTEALNVSSGQTRDYGTPGYTWEDDRLEFYYIEIPLLVKATFLHGDTRPYALAGPALGILLSSSVAYVGYTGPGGSSGGSGGFTVGVSNESYAGRSDLTSLTEKNNFSLDMGAGVEHALTGIITIFCEARSQFGLKEITGRPHLETIETRDLQVLGGLKIEM